MALAESDSDTAFPGAGEDGRAAARLGQPRGAMSQRGFHNAANAWPRRKLVSAVALSPVLFAVLISAAGGRAQGLAPGWTALVALVALGASATLASYLPRPGYGRRLDLGCTPCAAVAALSVVGAAWVLHSTPHDLSSAALALVIIGFGLAQRLTSPSSCAAPHPRAKSGDQRRP
ncbi:MAG: hypothetical protein ABIP19_13700 [Dermatophilaceae bacterium]